VLVTQFKRLIKQASLPDLRFHDLRHTSATLLLAQGVHPRIVQERLGHADISMTLNRYSQVTPDRQRSAETVDAAFREIRILIGAGRLSTSLAASTRPWSRPPMEPVVIASFALALVLNAGSPGPSVAALVSRVITNGWRDVAPFVLAMWLGEVAWLTVSMAGLTTLAQTFHAGFVLLKWLGIAYLCYLACKMWRAPTHGRAEVLPKSQGRVSMFAAGMALTLGNPKIMVFYLAVLPSLVTLGSFNVAVWGVFATTVFLVLMLVDCSWIAFATYARRLLRTPRAMRIANRLGATAMGGAAVAIATRR
jgi:threonine/homoserine/homoserine lactone efflux protein